MCQTNRIRSPGRAPQSRSRCRSGHSRPRSDCRESAGNRDTSRRRSRIRPRKAERSPRRTPLTLDGTAEILVHRRICVAHAQARQRQVRRHLPQMTRFTATEATRPLAPPINGSRGQVQATADAGTAQTSLPGDDSLLAARIAREGRSSGRIAVCSCWPAVRAQ